MDFVKIRSGTWSVNVRRDNPLFATFFESQAGIVGEVPNELQFDRWNWLPVQWPHYAILRNLIGGESWKWSTHLLSLDFSLVHYADVAALVGAMIDFPKGWESYTVIDKRTSLEDRKRLYKQNGEMIRTSIENSKDVPDWYSSLVSYSHPSEALDTLLYFLCVPYNRDTIIGAVWNSHLLAKMTRSQQSYKVDWEVLWDDYGGYVTDIVNRVFSPLSPYAASIHTMKYLAKPSVLLFDGMQLPITTQCPRLTTEKIEISEKTIELNRDAYQLSLEAFVTTKETTISNLGFILGEFSHNTSQVSLDYYAPHLHNELLSMARTRLIILHNDLKILHEPFIAVEYHFCIALFVLSVLGRKAISSIVSRYSKDEANTTMHAMMLTWRTYRHDKAFSYKMKKSFRENEFDHLLSIKSIVKNKNDIYHPKLTVSGDKWIAHIGNV